MEVARANTHEPKLLLWIKGNFVSQRQSDPRQLLARGRRRGWCLTSRKHVKLAVFGFRTAVRAILDSLRKATNVFSARRRIIGSVSASNTSRSNVSSADIDQVGRLGTNGFSSIPIANSYRRCPWRPKCVLRECVPGSLRPNVTQAFDASPPLPCELLECVRQAWA
jgi:hypothetical protein